MEPKELMRFMGRKNTFAEQLKSGIYIPIKRDINFQDLENHLAGNRTFGSYVIREDGKINYACIDIDGVPGEDMKPYLRLANRLMELFPEFERCLEFSGRRGYHIWLFPEEPEVPKFLRELIKTRFRAEGMINIEIYPKQDVVTNKGYGNLLKLPCGIHKKGGWSEIIRWEMADSRQNK